MKGERKNIFIFIIKITIKKINKLDKKSLKSSFTIQHTKMSICFFTE